MGPNTKRIYVVLIGQSVSGVFVSRRQARAAARLRRDAGAQVLGPYIRNWEVSAGTDRELHDSPR